MTVDILELMEESRPLENNAQLYKEIQRTVDTKYIYIYMELKCGLKLNTFQLWVYRRMLRISWT